MSYLKGSHSTSSQPGHLASQCESKFHWNSKKHDPSPQKQVAFFFLLTCVYVTRQSKLIKQYFFDGCCLGFSTQSLIRCDGMKSFTAYLFGILFLRMKRGALRRKARDISVVLVVLVCATVVIWTWDTTPTSAFLPPESHFLKLETGLFLPQLCLGCFECLSNIWFPLFMFHSSKILYSFFHFQSLLFIFHKILQMFLKLIVELDPGVYI